MITSVVTYSGELRTEARHLRSGKEILTDAPTDNQGRGEAFSPTDIVATALASCMFTIMGIVARRENMTSIEGASAEVTKVMYENPRRIGEIHIRFVFPDRGYSDKEKKIYENAAHTCPVAKSLSADIRQKIEFGW